MRVWTSIRISLFAFLAGGIWLSSSRADAAEYGLGSVDLRAGVAIPSEWDDGTSFGVSFDVGQLTSGLYLYPGIRYSIAEETESFLGIDIGLEVTDIAIGAEVRYFPEKEQRGWYFGGGAWIHFLDHEFRVGGGSVSASSEQIGPGGVVGYRWKGSRVSFFTEARYDLADVFDRGEVLVGISLGGE